MSSVDDRIVNMQFNNKQFTQGVTDSQKSLQSLEQSLSKTAGSSGMSDLASNVEKTSGKFGAMKVAGITAIATIASKATTMGIGLLKSVAIDPIMDGFREYQTNLNSIQTIIANTGAKLPTVNKYLNDLNHYSDQTIYNFGQMASAIGKFTAAGVSLPKATAAIKGMANAAALSGADANQLNSAMYQMSQALASGTIKLMDWNSLVNANMGGQNIQKALMSTAKSMGPVGVKMDEAIKQHGTFRDSLQEGWLTADVFSKTMKVMAGTTDKATGATVAFSEKQLIAMGYTKEQAAQLHKLSGASIDAATKIKTFPQMMDVVKESVGSGFAKIFQDLMGNFNQSTKMWTSVGGKITGVVGSIFGSLDKALLSWRSLGGYQAVWNGFGNIFKALGNIIHPFVAAFQTLMPATGDAGKGLANASKGFESVTHWIEVATRSLNILTPAFTFVFGVFKIGAQVAGALFKALQPLAPLFTNLVGKVSALGVQGQKMTQSFIEGLLKGLDPAAIQAAVTSFAMSIINFFKNALGIHSPSTAFISIGLDIMRGLASGLVKGLAFLGQNLGKVISFVWKSFGKLFKGFTAMDFAGLLNAIFTGAILLTTKKVLDFVDTWKGFGNNMQDVFDGIGESMKSWQKSLKAKMIMEIAIAIGILTASIIALSFVDPKKIAISLGAIATLMGELAGTMLALSKIGGDKQIAILATSMVLISTAMIDLAIAVSILGQQDPKKIGQGLGAMAIALGIMILAVKGMSGIEGQLVAASAGIYIMSAAMIVLAGAVLAFGLMDVGTLAKGLGAMAIGITLITGPLVELGAVGGKSVLAAAAGIMVVSAAMVVLAAAVATFGNMDMGTLAKGFGSVALGMTLMVASLLILSAEAPAVLIAAEAMGIMALAMIGMAVAVGMFGNMDMGTLAKGFGAIAVGFGILLLAAAGAELVAPGLIILGVAMEMLGSAMMMAGLGMALFGAGFAALSVAGVAGVAVLSAAFQAFMAMLPTLAQQLAAAFVAFFKVLANASGELRKSFGTIFKNILGVITDSIPEIRKVLQALINAGITTLKQSIPRWVEMGFTLIDKFMKSADKHIPAITQSALDLIVKFLNALSNNIQQVIGAGTDLIVKFLDGIGKASGKIANQMGKTILDILDGIDKAVNKYAPQIRQKGIDIALDLLNGLSGGILNNAGAIVKSAIESLASFMPGWLRKAVGANSPAKTMIPVGEDISRGVGVGITQGSKHVHKAIDDLAKSMDKHAKKVIPKTTASIVASAVKMANAIISEGDPNVARAQNKARSKEAASARAQTTADMARDTANVAKHHLNKMKDTKKNHKAYVKAQHKFNRLDRIANTKQKTADNAETAFQNATAAVDRAREFRDADLHGKGDIRLADATTASSKANRMLAQAQTETAAAQQLMKTNKKAGRAMLVQAQKDRDAARAFAQSAQAARDDANRYYGEEVTNRIASIEQAVADRAQARADEAAFNAADDVGKAAILTARAAADDQRVAAQRAAYTSFIAQARAAAATDAVAAMGFLDQAEAAAADADEAADRAEQERKDAADYIEKNKSDTTTDTAAPPSDTGGDVVDTGGGGATIAPSRNVLEEAAKIIDSYTESLSQATAMAGSAGQAPVQFTQNNYSPAALSASEVYRQSKNLLSSAEIKMGVPAKI